MKAILSVYDKTGIEELAKVLSNNGFDLISTGGTYKKIIENPSLANTKVSQVSDITKSPEILDGRVKTLHPKVFGGILSRRDHEGDREQMAQYAIPNIDLVVVDLYPFEETVASGASEEAIIEKIDIGGIALISPRRKHFPRERGFFAVGPKNRCDCFWVCVGCCFGYLFHCSPNPAD